MLLLLLPPPTEKTNRPREGGNDFPDIRKNKKVVEGKSQLYYKPYAPASHSAFLFANGHFII